MNYLLAFKEYLLALKPQPSKITVKNYSIDVKHFIFWAEQTFKHSFDPKKITASDIASFRKDKSAQLSTRSLDRHISSLRKFFQALKLQGVIAKTPFEEKKNQPVADPFHLKEFKDFLYVYNASHLTIKNYIIDVKQFFLWAKKIAAEEGIQAEDVLAHLTENYVSYYRDRLLAEHVFSPASINRKLSSIRKYVRWAASQNLMANGKSIQDNLNTVENVISAHKDDLPKIHTTEANMPTVAAIQKSHAYSPFPPFRLVQKLTRLVLIIFDIVISSPLAFATIAFQKSLWSLKGKPLFKKQQTPFLRQVFRVKNISKAVYAPFSLSTKTLPWYKKIIFHAKHTRPEWYKRYHSYAISHYFHWAILMIFMTIIGFGFYNSFITKPHSGQPLLAATAPPRILSFQGRLTDSSNNPITTATNLRFGIYNDQTATGSALLWQEVDSVQPDANGVFSVILGKNSTMQQSLFANNASLYLGITVGITPELTPRQQLATVAYATNAETLQGLPPITQSGAGTNNVVLALNSSGNLSIGAASTFQTVGGGFTLSGDTLAMNTNAGTNANITVNPDNLGKIDLQKPLVNTSNNNNIASAKGSVEVNDTFAVLATSSGIPAVTINQNGTGDIFTASSSGTQRFTIGTSGTLKATNFTTSGGILYTDATGLFLQTSSSNNTQCLIGGTTPTWTACSGVGQNYWQITNGALVPVNSTLDILAGGTSTNSAKFAVLNMNSGTPTASVSSGLNGTGMFFDSTGTIQTVNNIAMTIGGNTTGNITLSPLNGSGTVNVNGTGLQTTSSTFNLLTNTATNLLFGTTGGITTVNSTLTITGNITPNGQFAASLIPTTTAINLGSSSNNYGSVYATNLFLPTSGGTGGYWQLQNGALSPTNITNDVLVGGTSTASAKFAVLNMTGSATPVASVSSGLSGNAVFLTSDGTLQTARLQTLTIGGATTGNITLSPKNSTGTITFSGYTAGIIHSNASGILSSSPVNLAGPSAEISGILPLNSGGTNNSLTADSGGIVYSGASSLQILAHALSTGLCLVSGGTSAPSWSSCSSGSSQWWNMNQGALFPVNSTLDILAGGTSTNSAKFAVLNMNSGTPTASVSSGLNGTGMFFDSTGTIQTVNNIAMTIGGNTTGNITLSPLNGSGTVNVNGAGLQTTSSTFNLLTNTATTVNFAQGANNLNIGNTGGTTTFASSVINDSQPTVALLGSPTTVNFAQGATTAINIGSSTSPTNLNGNIVLGSSISNTFTPNALMNADLLPTGNGVINLGASTRYYNTVYANNFIAPVSGGTSGFWSLANNVIFPVNTFFDLAIGGTSTASASWQVFSSNLGSIVAGTASSSGMLSFRNPATKINLLNGAALSVQTSVGGDSGLTSVLTIANNGNITATGNITTAGNVAVNGGTLSTTQPIAYLFNTNASTVNIAGGASTATNIGHASGLTTLRGNLSLGTNNTNSITVNGYFASSLIPTTTNAFDLGTSSLMWRNIYTSGNYVGFWQRFNGVVSPSNITDDLLLGGTATTSAKFAFINNTGLGNPTASISGNLSLIVPTSITPANTFNILNNGSFNIQRSPGGDGGLTSSLFIDKTGNMGIGTTSPVYKLDVNGDINQSTNSFLRSGGNLIIGGNGFQTIIRPAASAQPIQIQNFAGGINAVFTDNGNVGIGTSNPTAPLHIAGAYGSNAALIVNQLNSGDIFTASASSTTQFTIANDGTIKNSLIPNITDTYNLGSDPNAGGKEWNNLYVRQIITPSTGGIAGFWQLNNGVVAPSNVSNDLAIGGASTASAAFQVFGRQFSTDAGIVSAGTASTSGNFTFRGTPNSQTAFQANILNNASLGFYNSVGGDKGITSSSPSLFLSANSTIGIGTNTPQGILDVAALGATFPSNLTLGQSAATNLVPNPSFEFFGAPLTGWTLSATAQLTSNNPATESALFGSHALRFYNVAPAGTYTATSACIAVTSGTNYTASASIYRVGGFSGNTGIDVQTFTNGTCSAGQATAGRVNTTATDAWTRLTTTVSTAGISSVQLRFITDGANTNSRAYIDGFQLEQASSASPYLDGSLGPGYYWNGSPNNSSSGRNASTAFAYHSLNSASGIGASSRGVFPTLQLDQNGTGDIIAASYSGVLQFRVPTNGQIQAHSFADLDNTAYFLDPAATNTSLTVAGSVGIGTTSPTASLDIVGSASLSGNLTFRGGGAQKVNLLNNSTLGFYNSVGGDAGLGTNPALFIANNGNVGIGTTNPQEPLHVISTTDLQGIRVSTSVNNIVGVNLFNSYTGGHNWGIFSTAGIAGAGQGVLAFYDYTAAAYRMALATSGDLLLYGGKNMSYYSDTGVTKRGQVGSGRNGDFTVAGTQGGSWMRIGNTGPISFWMDGNTYNNDSPSIIFNNPPLAGGWNTTSTLMFVAKDINTGRSINAAGSINGNGTDYAEYFKQATPGVLQPGDVVTIVGQNTVNKAEKNQNPIGVYSTSPSFVGGDIFYDKNHPENSALIGLIGQIPTKVSLENGPIAVGDPLAVSSIPGVATKATTAGQIIGYAEEPFAISQATISAQFVNGTWVSSNTPCSSSVNCYNTGKINVFVGKGWYNPNAYLASTGNLIITQQGTPSADFTVPRYYTLSDILGNPVGQIGAFAELVAANIRTGIVNSQQIFTNSLAIATDNVSIAGQSLKSYITAIVDQRIGNSNVLSPIAEIDQIHTNLISPLASTSAIAIDLSGSKFTIRSSATGSAVASIDNTGNATFSGTLNSKNLAVNSDATISGTLRANKIVANSIEGLSAIVGTLSAQNITNVTNIYFATPSATPSAGNYAIGLIPSSSSSGALPKWAALSSVPYANVASFSSYLAYVPNLSASTALFDGSLTSLGPTALSDTTITGQLSIGASLILADNSINVLGQSLEIQPLRQGGINFEGGLLAIDTNGNLTVNGNAVFAKNLAANSISPLSNDRNLTLKLGENPTSSGAAVASSQLSVQNASGSGIFSVDQLGNLVASGAANIAKLNFTVIAPALAVSDTEVIATGSAGQAVVKPRQTEVTIDNPLVSDKSLIYITPVGQSGVVPYLIRQVKGASFTVGISLPQLQNTTFNWLIVN